MRTLPRAFTLVETLITIAIIAALMSIAAPALMSARSAARSAQCGANIRQLQLANALYANHHQDRFIPGAVGIQTTNLHRWHGVRAGIGEPFSPDGAPITPYLEDGAVSDRLRACPSFIDTLDALRESGAGFERSSGGYGYNNAFVGVVRASAAGGAWTITTDQRGAERTRFDRPAETIAFTDSAFASASGADNLIEYSFCEPRYWPDFPGARPNPSIHFRHSGSCNVAWLDGHVSAEKRTFTWEGFGYGVDASTVGLGWFGAADDNNLFDYR